MKQEDFQVVAELYRFLATFDAEAIGAASKLPNISDNLRAALIALYNETVSGEPGASSPNAHTRSNSTEDLIGQTVALLTDESHFPSKRDLLNLAEELGVEVDVDAKMSRERLARRIAKSATEVRSTYEKLRKLTKGHQTTQTAGWVDLIRRGR